MAQLYCLVQNNAVTQGPGPLPFAFGNITGFNKVPDPTIYGWYPYSDPGAPSFNPSTQQLIESFVIDNKAVTQAYTVAALPPLQLQANQQVLVVQSQDARLQNKAQTALNQGNINSAVQYLLNLTQGRI